MSSDALDERARQRLATLRGVGSEAGRSTGGPTSGSTFSSDRPGPPDGLQPGMIVAGKFALVRVLDQDAFTQVFEAEDTLVGRRVALRVLRTEVAWNSDVVGRFRREASAAASIVHPSIATVLDVGRRSDGSFYVVQELLVGPTLSDHRLTKGPIPEAEALSLGRAIAGALAAAHHIGIVHREVRPQNVHLWQSPFSQVIPKLVGFRAARLQPTIAGRSAPLPECLYHAPEQVLGESRLDGRADVWSLGVMLYELMANAPPFEGSTAAAVVDAILAGHPPRLESRAPVRRETASVIHAALEPELAKRPPMRAFAAMLSELADVSNPPQVAFSTAASPAAETGWTLQSASRAAEIIELGDADLEEIELVEAAPDIEDKGTIQSPVPQSVTWDWMRGTAEVDSDFARQSHVDLVDRFADHAQRALRMNALDEAVVYAEAGVANSAGSPTGNNSSASGELLGQLQLVRTIAQFWLGEYARCDESALACMNALPRRSPGWYAAAGHRAMARAAMGSAASKLLTEAAEEEFAVGESAKSLAAGRGTTTPRLIFVCRVAIAMIQLGEVSAARKAVRTTRDRMDRLTGADPAVQAWLDVAFAERAAFVGDPARELPRRLSAVERFTSAGDVRNACEQRARVGVVLLRLGAFVEGERVLHEALGIAAPMKLHCSHIIKAYLGFAAFRQGEGARALSLASEAYEGISASGDRYGASLTHTFLGLIHALLDDTSAALEAAREAVESAAPFPALQSHSLAVLAATLVFSGRASDALQPATRAMKLLEEFGGAGEGEALVRLSHGLVLAQTGHRDDMRRTMKDARDRILGLAERLADPAHKRAFLDVSENARILQLGTEWLDAGP